MTDPVKVPRDLLTQAARWLDIHDSGGGSVEGSIVDDLRALLAAEPPTVEEVEVVGYMGKRWRLLFAEIPYSEPSNRFEPLMTVRQHEAILAAALAAK